MSKTPAHLIPLGATAGSHRASRDCKCGPRAHVDLAAGADPRSVPVWVHRIAPPPLRRPQLESEL